MRTAALAAMLLAAAGPWPAAAQSWKEYKYPDAGFSVQLPAAPSVAPGVFHTADGRALPQTTYVAAMDGARFSMTVVDYSGVAADGPAVIAAAEAALTKGATVTSAVNERVDRWHGRQISLRAADGSRSAIAVFFADNRLYELVGQSLPPDAAIHSGDAMRFQQSLVFVDRGGRAPPRPDDGLSGDRFSGGRGFGPPPPD